MAKEVHHSVKRPGLRPGDPDVEIPVAEDLATVPGHPATRARRLLLQPRVPSRKPDHRQGSRPGVGLDGLHKGGRGVP